MILVFLFQFISLSNLLCFSFSYLFILVYQAIGSPPHQNWLKVFFFMTEQYSMVYIYYNFFIHSSVNGYLGCFHVLAIVNSASMNIVVHVSFSIMVTSEHMLSQWDCWVLWQFSSQFSKDTPYCSPQWLYQFTFHQKCESVSFSPHPLQHLLFVQFLTMIILTGGR